MTLTELLLLTQTGAAGRRPAPCQQAALYPPHDPSPDELGNLVHEVLGQDQPMPRLAYAEPFFPVAQFGGIQIPGNYSFDGRTAVILDGRWQGLQIPFLVGANSTPPTMLMSCMLPLYSEAVQAAYFYESCLRGHNCIVTADTPWNAEENGFTWSGKDLVAYLRKTDSWGLKTFLWRGGDPRRFGPFPDLMIAAALDSGLVHTLIWGKEVDIQGMSGPDYEASIQEVLGVLKGKVRAAAHFSCDNYVSGGSKGEQGRSYPLGAPRDDFLRAWCLYEGMGLDLALQLACEAPSGVQGAYFGYAHQHVHLGLGDAVPAEYKGKGAPSARIYAFEFAATSLLFQKMTETDARRRGYQLACCGQQMAGSMDGLCLADGSPFLAF